MQLDDQMVRFFATADLQQLSPAALDAGVERMQVELGLETDRARRFALWSLMFMLGAAPDLDEVFAEPADRDAARNFMDLVDNA
ncbi:hypothetical protein [Sphingomonas xinjiangensis]|uniref:Uncharacterized protein n=1 Tax=Sphingomonas xinjiangensis TaxID=643568 RepID=A0A840YN71_9SPHN|nr:hypothetical protein [Sphingomonas xinjiangensis]MBB5709191.1 hypothetical protein [Sphingomonas xinjiangensis]